MKKLPNKEATYNVIKDLVKMSKESNGAKVCYKLHNCKTWDGLCVVITVQDHKDFCEEEEKLK